MFVKKMSWPLRATRGDEKKVFRKAKMFVYSIQLADFERLCLLFEKVV